MPTKMNTVLGQLNLRAIPQKCYISNYDSLHLIEEGWHWGRNRASGRINLTANISPIFSFKVFDFKLLVFSSLTTALKTYYTSPKSPGNL